jgi:CDP-alcohol phosphatidyltransferase-like enzyme
MRVLRIHGFSLLCLMVSTIPTYSGKLLGERISRERMMPLLVLAGALVALLVSYPYVTLTVGTLRYLALIPVSAHRFRGHMRAMQDATADRPDVVTALPSERRSPQELQRCSFSATSTLASAGSLLRLLGRAALDVICALDVILAKVAADLNLDQLEPDLARVLETIPLGAVM